MHHRPFSLPMENPGGQFAVEDLKGLDANRCFELAAWCLTMKISVIARTGRNRKARDGLIPVWLVALENSGDGYSMKIFAENEFPHTFDRIEFRTVGGEKIQLKLTGIAERCFRSASGSRTIRSLGCSTLRRFRRAIPRTARIFE